MRTRVGGRILAGVTSGVAAVLFIAILEAWPLNPAGGDPGRANLTAGESSTVLPDGRLLLVGGEGRNGRRAWLEDPRTGTTTPVAATLNSARAWHTATLLPDGNVLVFGGIGAGGQVLAAPEQLDPSTFTDAPMAIDLPPRALHTATLLTDGRVLLAGGLSEVGAALSTLTLWDARTGIVESLSAQLETARYGHHAMLLANGLVALWGGFDDHGSSLDNVEFFDPDSFQVTADGPFTPPLDPGPPTLVASLPPDGATDAPVGSLIALRFSKSLEVESANEVTVQLEGPEGTVSTRVVPAEAGMLVFVTPAAPLRPGVTYALTVDGVTDATGLTLPTTTIRFTTVATSGPGAGQLPASEPATPQTLTSADSQPPADAGDEDWIPNLVHSTDWQTGRPASRWQSLPPRQAARGITALAGQVVRLNGEPLANVRLELAGRSARTDATGRFLVGAAKAGHAVLIVDGGETHGVFEVGVDLAACKTTALPFTIWLPKIDLAHAVTIPSPTTQEVVVTTPQIPGLELHIPAGTVIRDYTGAVVHRVSLTPVPLDRPPFPLPNLPVPLYFTAQPGAAYLTTPRGEGARLIYPNKREEPAGTRFDFWNYNADDQGWYVYGRGTVRPSGEQFVPDPSVSVYEFTGAMVAASGNGPGSGPTCGGGCCNPASGDGPGSGPGSGPGGCGGGGGGDTGSYDGEPVHLATGLFVRRETDLTLPDSIPISLVRAYRQNDSRVRAFGLAATHSYDIFIEGDNAHTSASGVYTYIDLVLPDVSRIHYDRVCSDSVCNCQGDPNLCTTSTCVFTNSGCGVVNAVYEHVSTPTIFYKSHIAWVGQLLSGHWELTLKDGTVYEFQDSLDATRPPQAGVIGIRDRFGHRVALTRSGVCQGGTNNGGACTTATGCPSGGKCITSYNVCQGGTNAGAECTSSANCPSGGTCVATGDLLRVTSPHGRWLAFTYGSSSCPGCITRVTDNAGRTVLYTYDQYNRLTRVQDPNVTSPGITTYAYDGQSERMVAVCDARWNASCSDGTCGSPPVPGAICNPPPTPTLTVAYAVDGSGNSIVQTQTLAEINGVSTYGFSYQPMTKRCHFGKNAGTTCTTNTSCNGAVPAGGICFATSDQTTVTDPNQNQHVVNFNTDGYSLSDSRGSGARVVSYSRVTPGSNFITAKIEPLTASTCRKTTYTYDQLLGNLLTQAVTSGACSNPVTTNLTQTTFTYESRFNQLSSVTTPAGPTTFTYLPGDPLVRLSSITDGSGLVFPVAIDGEGRLVSASDPLNHATTFTYDGGDLVAVTDALNNTTRRFVDAAGRLRSVTDPVGHLTRYDYDNSNHLTQVTDPQQGTIAFQYDGDGNLKTVTDSRHSPNPATTMYDYTPRNWLYYRTDPLGRVETYGYDGVGNLITQTDRRSVVSDFFYDALNRRTCASYGRTGASRTCSLGSPYESGTTYAYDQGSRLTQTLDSLAGVGNRTYDDLDNLTRDREQLGGGYFGDVSYTYDAASRRTSMTVVGQPTIGYCYDGASRLTKILQGTLCSTDPTLVNIAYDAGRRGTVTLPNADTVTYSYDPASRLSSLQYMSSIVLGGLTYTYDAAGNRIQVGGISAKTGLPVAMNSATYDPADRLQTWNGTGLPLGAFDKNGNLLNDGTNIYHWNARNQLDQINGGAAAFVYDAFGRRVSKTLGGTTTLIAPDGRNPVQELDGSGNVTANVLTGLKIDDFFRRTTGSGGSAATRVFLPDALGSAVALTDQTGSQQTLYRYEPFGQESIVQGTVNDSNPYQFTGRENDGTGLDGTGLFYYRARYYSPTWGRFISEDPLPGVSLYQYVGDNPINHLDPLGLFDCQGQWVRQGSERVFNVTCKCYWLCLPCNGEYIYSGNLQGLPFTYGTFIYTGGGGLKSGDVCFCPQKPGGEVPCSPCPPSSGGIRSQ